MLDSFIEGMVLDLYGNRALFLFFLKGGRIGVERVGLWGTCKS